MYITADIIVPNVIARQINKIDGVNHTITNVKIVGVTLAGLVVSGMFDGKVYWSAVSPQTFYVWYCENFVEGKLKYIPEPEKLRASQTVWYFERSKVL